VAYGCKANGFPSREDAKEIRRLSPLTFIDTNELPRSSEPGKGAFADFVNESLCGAKNAAGTLRWLNQGDKIEACCDTNTHQLIYVRQGEAVVTLNSQQYPIGKGAGVYLGPSEAATIKHAGSAPLQLFHLVVRKLK
jgi:hypothetical protein